MINKFDFNDILIKPSKTSDIKSRQDINPRRTFFLPLITAPMDTVISEKNKLIYSNLNIITCLPRGEKNNSDFESYSLREIEEELNSKRLKSNGFYLIDIANGHMSRLITVTKKIKRTLPKVTLMVGNVANPETYVELSNAGADYIRVGIGNGGGCFVGETKVITKDGEKDIKDIIIDDLVLTHTGEFKLVSSTLAYPTSESLIKINETISTKKHEYYVVNKKFSNLVNDNNIHEYAEWLSADLLTKEYFLLEYVTNV